MTTIPPKIDPKVILAEAQADPLAKAHEILLRCMLGFLPERTADSQRRAAMDVLTLGGRPMKLESDEALIAEVYRRGLQVPTVDLDAAERAVTGSDSGKS